MNRFIINAKWRKIKYKNINTKSGLISFGFWPFTRGYQIYSTLPVPPVGAELNKSDIPEGNADKIYHIGEVFLKIQKFGQSVSSNTGQFTL